MKKHWYYVDEKNERHGPMSLEELKTRRILKKTMVWNETMSDWDKAQNIDELKDVIIDKIQPPPFVNKENEEKPIENKQGPKDISSEDSSEFTSKDVWSGIWAAISLLFFVSIFELFYEKIFYEYNYLKRGLLILVICINYYHLIGKYLRKYLNISCAYSKANIFIDITVFSFITLNIIQFFYDVDNVFASESVSFISIVILVLLLTFVISFIGLAVKLLFIENDFSGLTKIVGASMIFSIIYTIYAVMNNINLNPKEPFSSDNLWYFFLMNLPYLMLIILFIVTLGKLNEEKLIK